MTTKTFAMTVNGRRNFIRQMLIAAAGVALLPEFLRAQHVSCTQVRILHTGNLSSGMVPYENGIHSTELLKEITSIIREEREKDPSLLVFDSGGLFRSIPGFHHFGGVPEIQLMNKAGYLAMTPGIHDFDNGNDKLAELMKHAGFQLVNCNYQISHKALSERVIPFVIINSGSMKIGVTGVGADLKKWTEPRIHNHVKFKDPAVSLNSIANQLIHKESCDLVLALSHLSHEENLALASVSENTTAILGASFAGGRHTHTDVKNKKGLNVKVSTAGASTPGIISLNI